jgi:hypothetical protein
MNVRDTSGLLLAMHHSGGRGTKYNPSPSAAMKRVSSEGEGNKSFQAAPPASSQKPTVFPSGRETRETPCAELNNRRDESGRHLGNICG